MLLIPSVTLIRGQERASALIKTDTSDPGKHCSFTEMLLNLRARVWTGANLFAFTLGFVG